MAGSDGDDGSLSWTRLSDGVAPINVTCSGSSGSSDSGGRGDDADEPTTSCASVFHVAAYSRHVEKILDVTISQPGACCLHDHVAYAC